MREKLTGRESHQIRMEIYNQNQNEDFQREIDRAYQHWISCEIEDYIGAINCDGYIISYTTNGNGEIRTCLEDAHGIYNGIMTLMHTYHLWNDFTESLILEDLRVIEDLVKGQDAMSDSNRYLLDDIINERIDEVLIALDNRLNELCNTSYLVDFFCNVYWTDYMDIHSRHYEYDTETFEKYQNLHFSQLKHHSKKVYYLHPL